MTTSLGKGKLAKGKNPAILLSAMSQIVDQTGLLSFDDGHQSWRRKTEFKPVTLKPAKHRLKIDLVSDPAILSIYEDFYILLHVQIDNLDN